MHAMRNLDARAEVRKWLPVLKATLGLSQNGFAREAKIDQSILSRWLNGHVHESAAENKALATLRRLRKRLVADEMSA